MRPHRLWITAFGSFPAEEEVDFDALTEAGLFLIHGPTGAGKTTVLDALCYALYGRVPGKRDSAKSLRCDHAPPGRGPSVALEVTIRGRRLKITRSPSWQRPKLRGTGTTRENEKALLQELNASGEWIGLTTRVDEAGELIGTLLGMNADQFFQVAMLPQGDFAKFLRADGEDRRKVLERLFSVKIYAAAESWLADRRTEAHREQQSLRREVDFAAKRLEEAAGPALITALAEGDLPDDAASGDLRDGAASGDLRDGETSEELQDGSVSPDGAAFSGGAALGEAPDGVASGVARVVSDLAEGAGPRSVAVSVEEDPLEWAHALEKLAGRMVARVSRDCAEGEVAVRESRTSLEYGAALADRRRRHAEALTRSRMVEETAEERVDLQATLTEAARADRLLPLIQGAEQRSEAAAKASQLAADAVARALPLLAAGRDPSPDLLATLERDRQSEITRLRELRTEESRLATIVQERERAGREIVDLTAAQAEADARLEVLPGLRLDVDARLTAARLDAARVPAAESAAESAAVLLRAAERRESLAAELSRARADLAAKLAVLPVAPDEADESGAREALASWERERREELAGLEGLRADEARLAELDGLLTALDLEIQEFARQESVLHERQEGLPAESADASARLAAARAQAAGIPAARAAAGTAAAVLGAARRRDDLRTELKDARAAEVKAVDEAQDLRDRHQDLRQARIEGMAAELAAKLSPGDPCAVCGSPDHPAPAAPAAEAPTAEDERTAQSAYETATERRRDAGNTVTALSSRLEEALAIAGDLTVRQAEETLAEAERELEALTSAASTEEALAAEVERLAAELDEARREAAELARRLTGDRMRLAGWQAEHDRLTARLDGARGMDSTVQARRDRLTGEAALLAVALAAATLVAELAAGHREACDRTDLAVELARAGLAEAERALTALRESAEAERGLLAEADALAAELGLLGERSRELAVALAARRTNVEGLTADAEQLTGRINEARGHDATLAARLERLTEEADLLGEAVEATREERTTAAELATARERALAAIVEAGFLGLDDARAAIRPAAELKEKTERLQELDRASTEVAALLADPELIAAAAEPEPDLAGLRAARDAADAVHAGLLSERHQAEARRARLAALRTELAACLERWLPAAERHRLTERLAALTGGNSTDNQWNMRLSSYVLGERLRQVVESANERLDHMSGGRYLLEHNLSRTAGDRSKSGGGLGLRILDAWTGVDRDPATLSGGESFVTSLALALGLADVVTAEAGGVELGTLFVDEGFGTLDEDTLDGVLDILDNLRDGGRAVGIVSHVAELRTRVPAQLRVRKERRGSTLSTTTS
ncbi:AAA family ATPase [Streptosporangium sp. 'caverna']|uniref:AAA family ATPase n=1 Tax=Streptosporangium sp. 'caverna' TaxID=2202249 RepID=UPI000D7E3F19|nr:AAA family ATPase [Streptosporangium sp. 'caverna']AWS45200.1 ATP-binding cassette family protein [Streptosporangium sp. 'caverna']